MAEEKIRVPVTGKNSETAYVALPDHGVEPGIVSKTVSLDDAIAGYAGPRVYLDFDKAGKLIGVEILA